MFCEKCGTKGFQTNQMFADGPVLVGPCCHGGTAPVVDSQMNYGVELSSRNGLLAYVEYGGLSLQYHKTPEQLRGLFKGNDAQEIMP